ncbi:hypothetical protein C8R44DRAFT_778503 [Mycena epipterygia]|nr:hypothetical protein C8R44DRAFT_778503 [Mycena epipterygia]
MADNHGSCTAVLETHELCDHIIDFLHDSEEDLQSCALVSHAFTFPAQRHLFQEVSLVNPLTPGTKAATRLREIMDIAPHLRHLVRRASAAINVDILTQLTNMHLTHLNHLTLLNMSPGSVGIPALSVARDLLVIPSLHTLVIDAGFPSRAGLNLLFARCTPSLRSLDLRYVTFFSGSENAEPSVEEPGPRTQITSLRLLRSSPEVSAWFLDPQCPIQTSRLQHVDFYEVASPALIRVLEAVPGIEVVRLRAHDVTAGISLASFPALTKLRLIGHPHEIEAALASFPRALDRLHTLILASGTLTPSLAFHVDALKRIDARLAELHLPALARLEMSVPPSSDLHPHHDLAAIEATHAAVTDAFVCMGKRGVLVVRDFRVWD